MKNFLKKIIKKITKDKGSYKPFKGSYRPNKKVQFIPTNSVLRSKFKSGPKEKEIERLKKKVAALEYLVEYWMTKHENFRAALNEELDRATAACEISDHPEDQMYLCGWSDQAWSMKDYLNCLFPEED